MGYDSGCIADANFLLFRLSLSARRTGDGERRRRMQPTRDFMVHLLFSIS
jgi:hypothetical protein